MKSTSNPRHTTTMARSATKPRHEPEVRTANKKKPRRTPRPRAKKPEPRTISVQDAVNEAFMEITTLQEEMASWRDGMEEKLSHTEKYNQVSEAADTLEGVGEPDMTETIECEFTWQDPTPRARGFSRAARLGQAVALLQAASDALGEYNDDEEQEEADRATAVEMQAEIDGIIGEVDAVDFPGMY